MVLLSAFGELRRQPLGARCVEKSEGSSDASVFARSIECMDLEPEQCLGVKLSVFRITICTWDVPWMDHSAQSANVGAGALWVVNRRQCLDQSQASDRCVADSRYRFVWWVPVVQSLEVACLCALAERRFL